MKDGEFAWSGLGSEEMEGGGFWGRPEIASDTGSTDLLAVGRGGEGACVCVCWV